MLELNEGAVGAVNARVSFTGCTFRRNRADRSSVGGSGGALWLFGASANATIDGCTFDANEAPFAPAIHSVSATLSVLRSTVQRHAAARNTSPIEAGGTVIIRGSTFTDNTSLGDGGAIFLTTASAEITDSRFVRNTASLDGGAIYSLNSTLRVARSIFASNRASATGGAIAAVLPTSGATTPVVDLTSDRFDANSALRGGAVATSVTSTTAVPLMRVTNAQFTGNTASASGGAAAFEVGRVVVVNSTFFGNTAPANPIVLGASTLSIANSALWTDGVSSFALPAGATLQWSAVPGAFVGEGNLALTASPFERQSGTDGVLGTSDDVMALAPGSPCIDAGSNALLPTDTWDLDGDGDRAEPLPRDLTDAARVVGVRVDLGAFESR